MANSQIEIDSKPGQRSPLDPATIAIAATFTAEPLRDSLEFWIESLQLQAKIEFAPYNHVLQSLLDSRGLFARNKLGMNVVLVRFEDWERFHDQSKGEAAPFEEQFKDLMSAIKTSSRNAASPILLCACPASTQGTQASERAASFQRMEEELASELSASSTIRFVSSAELLNRYPLADYYDAAADKLGHIPFTEAMFAALGTVIARNFSSLRRAPSKVIVLDCDQTLWAGVCGEMEPRDIAIDRPRHALQTFMRAQHQQGMLLCVCSKNNPEDVQAVFDAHPEMPLRGGDIAAWRVNWQAKSENVRSLAKELGLGLDSFIFVDDNPTETAEVQAHCPGVLTLTLPEVAERIPQFLDHVWAFDRFSVTAEDRNRTALYQENRVRKQVQEESASYADFLARLAIEIDVRELKDGEFARAAQLTQRTNQFNLTTRRHSEPEIKGMMESGAVKILTTSVRDRFGDYGQVGLIVYGVANERIQVHNFLLSCRALGKGVEHAMLARLGEVGQAESLSHIDLPYVPTARNVPARNFLASFPSVFREELEEGCVYHVPVDFAAGVRFNPPQGEEPEDSEPILDQPHKPVEVRSPGLSFEEIATGLNDAGLILKAVQAPAREAGPIRPSVDPPRNEMERQITLIWQRALAVSPIGIHDNYFDLGGDSLQAVRIFVELQELTGQNLPLVTLFEAPTVAQLAKLLGDNNWKPHWRSLVPIKSSGARPPFYCVHGVGGNVIEFMDLARHVHLDQPLYGIQAIGLDGKSCRENLTVEQMAAHYITEIREFQPRGPYYLGGSSFGGGVAYEMARQLRAKQQEIGIVALFDTYGPNYPRLLPTTTVLQRKVHRLRYRASLHWSNFVASSPRERPQYVWSKIKRCKRAFFSMARSLFRKASTSAKQYFGRFAWPDAIRDVNRAGHWAAADYVPGEYDDSITLFRATVQPSGICPDPTLGWSAVVKGKIEVYETPGHHGAIVREPRAPVLAAQLEDALRKAFLKAGRGEAGA